MNRNHDLVGMVNNIFRVPTFNEGFISSLPLLAQAPMGGTDPSSVYAMSLPPRMPRGVMGRDALPPESPIEARRAAGTDVARGTIPYRPSPDAEIPPYRPVPLPPERPADLPYDSAGFGSYAENVPTKAAGFDMKGTGGKLRALGGGSDSGSGRGESMYAPAPSIISPGMAGAGGGRDVDLTKYLRGLLMRRG